MAAIDSKTTLPLALILPMLMALGGGAVAWASTKDALAVTDERSRDTAAKVETLRESLSVSQTELAVIRAELAHVREAMDRVETKLGTRP